MAADDHSPREGYALSSLFLLVATVAVLLGMAAPILHHLGGDIDVDQFWGATLASGFGMALLGAGLGSLHYRRARGMAWGIITGAVLGLCCGPLVFMPLENFGWLLAAAVASSALIVGLATAIRLSGPRQLLRVRAVLDPGKKAQPKPHPLDPD